MVVDREAGQELTTKNGAASAVVAPTHNRLFVLDGVRAISILLVLATHMLPIGPKSLDLNEMTGRVGMALFFTLSGFLITTQLYARRNVAAFFVRRLTRIVPLAWLWATFVILALFSVGPRALPSHLFFFMNYDYAWITGDTGHFWSLCVEVHFYLFVGLLLAITRFRGFALLPFICAALIILRTLIEPLGTINTHLRVDEILTGAVLGLIYVGHFGPQPRRFIEATPIWALVLLLLLTSHEALRPINSLRGIVASILVGHVLFHSEAGAFRWMGHRALKYIAEVSYALYVIHPATMHGWLGSGDKMEKYAKRPLCFLLTFGLAHLSTFYFEHPIMNWGKKIAARLEKKSNSLAQPQRISAAS